MKTGIERAVKAAGNQTALAKRLGVSQACVWAWLKRGWVPVEQAVVIEAEFGVPSRDLVNPRIVELVDCWAKRPAELTCDLV
jgi:DNA-binding transcriptional regulator YdaS (Cro superfamily)